MAWVKVQGSIYGLSLRLGFKVSTRVRVNLYIRVRVKVSLCCLPGASNVTASSLLSIVSSPPPNTSYLDTPKLFRFWPSCGIMRLSAAVQEW